MATTVDLRALAGMSDDLDEPPSSHDAAPIEIEDGKVACPECGKPFKPGGLQRHITVVHGKEEGTSTSGPAKRGKRGTIISETGAQFQRTVSVFVAFACKDCALVLYSDADKDWIAIDNYCERRPNLRKQVVRALELSDVMILLGVFMGTAQKMVAHHSLGDRLSFGVAPTASDADHAQHNGSMQNMAQFLQAMSEEDRNEMINGALAQMAGNGAQ